MELDSGGLTDFLMLPAEEAKIITDELKKAEKTNDIEALKWCARRIVWLDDVSEIISSGDNFYPAHVFNKAWEKELKSDTVPDSMTAIIALIEGLNHE